VADGKKPTPVIAWIAGGCGMLVLLYLLVSCLVPMLMYSGMGLFGGGSGRGGTPAGPVTTPVDFGPPSTGGPMLPYDPSAPADAGVAADNPPEALPPGPPPQGAS
jgi:hypothetical protein